MLISFFELHIELDLKIKFVYTHCCDPLNTFDIAKELIKNNVIVSISIGGDGCQGGPPEGLHLISESEILKGFEEFRKETGINFHGVDFDWESNGGSYPGEVINKIGKALRPSGYFVTAVPMSS